LPRLKNNPRISIVIPVKNRPKEIKCLLRELLKQTLLPYEVIVVDDSDDEQIKHIVENLKLIYQLKRIKLRYIRNSNSSSRARLLGGLVAQGDIIIYVDDDLNLKPYALEYLTLLLTKANVVAVWGKIDFPDMKQTARNELISLLSKFLKILIFGSITYGGGLFAIYKEILNKGVSFDWMIPGYALFEDQDFSRNIIKYYGFKSVVMLDSLTLAINTKPLIRDENFFRIFFGNSIYLCLKWRRILGLISIVYISPFICLFYIMSKGGLRGKISISLLRIIRSYLYIIRGLSKIISGNLTELYTPSKNSLPNK